MKSAMKIQHENMIASMFVYVIDANLNKKESIIFLAIFFLLRLKKN